MRRLLIIGILLLPTLPAWGGSKVVWEYRQAANDFEPFVNLSKRFREACNVTTVHDTHGLLQVQHAESLAPEARQFLDGLAAVYEKMASMDMDVYSIPVTICLAEVDTLPANFYIRWKVPAPMYSDIVFIYDRKNYAAFDGNPMLWSILYSTIPHEFSHALLPSKLDGGLKRVPMWVHEGFSEFVAYWVATELSTEAEAQILTASLSEMLLGAAISPEALENWTRDESLFAQYGPRMRNRPYEMAFAVFLRIYAVSGLDGVKKFMATLVAQQPVDHQATMAALEKTTGMTIADLLAKRTSLIGDPCADIREDLKSPAATRRAYALRRGSLCLDTREARKLWLAALASETHSSPMWQAVFRLEDDQDPDVLMEALQILKNSHADWMQEGVTERVEVRLLASLSRSRPEMATERIMGRLRELPLLAQWEAVKLLRTITEKDFGYAPGAHLRKRERSLDKWGKWYQAERAKLAASHAVPLRDADGSPEPASPVAR